MRALILGGGGQLARELVKGVPAGVSAFALGRAECDITLEGAVEDAFRRSRPDVVVNTAAYTAVDKAESERDLAFSVNAEAVLNVAKACDRYGARLIQISTDYVFDGKSSIPYKPDAPTSPLNVYGSSKRDGETFALTAALAVVVRTSWLYAAHGNNFVRTMVKAIGSRPTVRVVDDQTGTPTAAMDLASMLWKLAANPSITGPVHWTNGGAATWHEFAVSIKAIGLELGLFASAATVLPVSSQEYAAPAIRPSYSVLDTAYVASLNGFEPRPWAEALRSTMEEIKSSTTL